MTESSHPLISRERELLHELHQVVADRARSEPELTQQYKARRNAAERDFEEAYQSTIIRFATDKEAADREREEALSAIETAAEKEKVAAEREHSETKARIRGKYDNDKSEIRTALQEARWTATAVYEGSKAESQGRLREDQARVAARMDRLYAIQEEARKLLTAWKQPTGDRILPPPGDPAPSRPPKGERPRLRNLQECVAEAEQLIADLNALTVPHWLKGRRLLWITLAAWLLLIVPLGGTLCRVLKLEPNLQGMLLVGLASSSVLSLAVGFGVAGLVSSIARRQVRDLYEPLCEGLAESDLSRVHILATFSERCRREIHDAKQLLGKEVRHHHGDHKKQRTELRHRRDHDLTAAYQHGRARLAAAAEKCEQEIREVEQRYQRRRDEIQKRFDTDSKFLHDGHHRHVEEMKNWHEREWTRVTTAWEQGLARVRVAVREVNTVCGGLSLPWDDPSWQTWAPPHELPPAIRFGSFPVGLSAIPDGHARSDRLKGITLDNFRLPALLGFPERFCLLLEAGDSGRNESVALLQAAMFRLLTSLPPGKVRFVIVDPVRLGENFAAFMHLADHDDALVASRIWTEPSHIEQRLTDLTAHMENVIQKYLRDRYASIAEYNAQAGEVAEPFRVLVVANFPVNFTPEAARRLLSIAQSGPRCGVATLIGLDQRQPLPAGFHLADLEKASVTLRWDETAGQRHLELLDTAEHASMTDGPAAPERSAAAFAWQDADFGRYPLLLDTPPPADLGHQLLQVVGVKAREASRVEVPFDFIAPAEEHWWSCDSRSGLRVPLGRAGATKRQLLSLGQGTSQHVLVAGKTGSGKSTLLHVLITNLGLLYNPHEAELYLIDFKKGVEFKTYAALGMPHARVVAIESEREFGLSVLQRLDAELKIRGDKFRDAGTQDLAGYRNARPDEPMPRILLIVDEFQEFFTEDDRISQDAAQLLDRLVRQGRAFGLHVLLGSQTLGGAYSLARSTIDQMAVRIALQCSEADAQLILSDDNAAARLLSRPGEAIYNDANGRIEGNDPFQIVWLDDDRRERYLTRMREMATARFDALPPQVVFEGNALADVSRNAQLERLLHGEATAGNGALRRGYLAWLGEAIAIKDPTAATFRRQSGSNLLVVGQQDELAIGMLATAAVGLATQAVAPTPCVWLLDGSPVDAPYAGFLARLAFLMPAALRVGGVRNAAAFVTELTAELERRRQAADGEAMPPLFLLVFGLHRFRDLRKAEDDFGFVRRDEAPNPAQQLATLLREGSSLGMHVLTWCDTLTNLQRALDRQSLREFEMRVLFQMGVSDSSNLIDTPAAAKLGPNRGLYFSEEEGRLEKFRPYGLPPDEWLRRAADVLRLRDPALLESGERPV